MSRLSGFCSHTEKALVRNRGRGGPVIPSIVSFTMCHAVNAAAAGLRPRGNGLQVPGSAQTLHSLRSATMPIYSSASPGLSAEVPNQPCEMSIWLVLVGPSFTQYCTFTQDWVTQKPRDARPQNPSLLCTVDSFSASCAFLKAIKPALDFRIKRIHSCKCQCLLNTWSPSQTSGTKSPVSPSSVLWAAFLTRERLVLLSWARTMRCW